MNEPLDLEPIKARLEHVAYGLQAREDVTALLAEVERLRGEAESEARARRFNSKMSNYLMDVIGRDEPEVREAEARIKAGDNHSEENSFGHIAAAYIMRLRGEVARRDEHIIIATRRLDELEDLRRDLARQAEQITAAWDEGEGAGWGRANRKWSDEPNLERATNPYRSAS